MLDDRLITCHLNTQRPRWGASGTSMHVASSAFRRTNHPQRFNGAFFMAKRKSISARTRFEVFKRDSFKCQYCGASAPDVLLEVDHINPVANGGTNDILNLVTACEGCNGGKSDKLLSDSGAVGKQRTQLELLQARREQLDLMFQWQKSLSNLDDEVVDRLSDEWHARTGYLFSDHGRAIIRKHVKKYGVTEVLAAIEIAVDNYLEFSQGVVTRDSADVAFGKIGGICHFRRVEKEDPDLREIYRVRAILRNRSAVNEREIIPLLRRAIENRVDMGSLRKLAATVRWWAQFRDAVECYCDAQEAGE